MDENYGKQLIWIITGAVLAMVFLLIDSRFFETFAYALYGLGLFLLLLVLVVGSEIKGAKSWIQLPGGFSLQPSETAKYFTALAVTRFLTDQGAKFQQLETKLKMIALLAAPAALIMLQPDTGSTLVYGAFIFVMYREGLSGNVLLAGVAAVVLFILALLLNDTSMELPFGLAMSGVYVLLLSLGVIAGLVYLIVKRLKRIGLWIALIYVACTGYLFSVRYVFDNVLSDHQRDRINELLGIVSDPRGAGYNVHQSKIAIGSGGFIGKGFLQGTQTKLDYVPEQSTDFIFCTVGEEWGFVGSLVIVLGFSWLFIKLILVAERQRSRFARIYGYCVVSILFFHFAINIAMTIGLAPVIGIPLPFFSYGGSSLWAFTILLFTMIRLDAERKFILR